MYFGTEAPHFQSTKFWLISSESMMSQNPHFSAQVFYQVDMKWERGGTNRNWGNRLSPLLLQALDANTAGNRTEFKALLLTEAHVPHLADAH